MAQQNQTSNKSKLSYESKKVSTRRKKKYGAMQTPVIALLAASNLFAALRDLITEEVFGCR